MVRRRQEKLSKIILVAVYLVLLGSGGRSCCFSHRALSHGVHVLFLCFCAGGILRSLAIIGVTLVGSGQMRWA